MKKILGLDVGITSIGWAFVLEGTPDQSRIVRLGVRVNPLTTDEADNFEKGKPITETAGRTLKRSMRRNLQRYKQRRANLISILKQHHFISADTPLWEEGKGTTHSTHALRAKAAEAPISLQDLARVLLMLNKKRGYRSSRKVKSTEEGQAIDGMAIARQLYEQGLTPGQLAYQLLQSGKRHLPDFYRSDLRTEFDKVWNFQRTIHPEILTPDFKKAIDGKGLRATNAIFWTQYGFNTADVKGSRSEKKNKTYAWRAAAINTPLSREEMALVIAEINGNIANSSGYLGEISDRSKALIFSKQTVGQYQYAQLQQHPHTSLVNQVFYRQDYMDEFEKIWETQAQYHKELTPQLKRDIRDVIIFYQRKLRSQKGLISVCQFENRTIESPGGHEKNVGYKVAPRSSPLVQEFKIWQNLGHLDIWDKSSKIKVELNDAARQMLFDELNIKGKLPKEKVLKLLGLPAKTYEANFTNIEGNTTQKALYNAYLKILEQARHEPYKLLGLDPEKDELSVEDATTSVTVIKKGIAEAFTSLGINTAILEFNAELPGKAFEQQLSYQLWHLLYSYESDNSASGNDTLQALLKTKFGFSPSQASILADVPLLSDYANLSAKAIRKIFPYIKVLNYSEACAKAGYNHSASLTKEENEQRALKSHLRSLPKNSLRNPVVEKILNQLINVVNAIIDNPELGKPDEIRIELARELKKNAAERQLMTADMAAATNENARISRLITEKFGFPNPTRSDVIKYKLYEELKMNGYKTLYSNTFIPEHELFSNKFDIEHIVPKALLFDDSFSNKTICLRKENIDKANRCAIDYIQEAFGTEEVDAYKQRVEMLYQCHQKNKTEGISRSKYKKLLQLPDDLGKGFIDRDLRDSQYIARQAKQMLEKICRTVTATTGSITKQLREDWGLVNIMQEINIDKYRALGLTELIEKKDGSTKERITEWSKRNDHRHHAMDALTVAFTKPKHIKFFNTVNARNSNDGKEVYSSQTQKFIVPMINFRQEATYHLEHLLISHKAKNKVVTKNKNRFKTAAGAMEKIELTPRGQLHKETIYGQIKVPVSREEKVGGKFTADYITRVASKPYRDALLQRLSENGNDSKKAFTGKNSLEKNPLFAADGTPVPLSVKIVEWETDYTIRKDVTPENLKDEKVIAKIIDPVARKVLMERFEAYNRNPKEAFSNLEKNPIWLNQQKGICIKRVTISGITNAEALHFKRDHRGKFILNAQGNPIPVDFISTGNNHHLAVYRDKDGNLQDNVVSFYEVVARAHQGLPAIDKTFNREEGWEFLFSMKQNECFVFPGDGFDPREIDLLNPANNKIIAPNLYRVQKLSKTQKGNSFARDYTFRHIYETEVKDRPELKNIAYKRILSLSALEAIVKVRINHIGQIINIGKI
ncbi:type II CRISPR RNA-guided endonuclease Cas9 [Chitinophaga parva]|uniref:CRISPR-associated endonuclease Cas9 n=1 Tax=Chitinophaga parva TaxID=2169414 RepID=A0A2T7BNX5_9BACT|nr:type II CRISPR RNA-guided endonuclease Cas9 [Chitinophaga parva]PUZ29378.1 type II CRISPR RNA-guided endonuclease Cas9 [Chitinophaga parva]